jgi:serine protease
MKRHFVVGLVVTLCFLLLASASTYAQDFKYKPISKRAAMSEGVEYVRGEVLVKYKEGVPQLQMDRVQDKIGARLMSIHRGGIHKLAVPAGRSEQELISLLRSDPNVEYAQLNTICHAMMIPNDPYYSPYQWDLPKINCPAAWDISTGSSVVVGILDSGIAYENYPVPSYELGTVAAGVTQYQQCPDLAGTSFTAGYDFINDDSHPNDNDAHGTHVAGTVAQTTNNSYGVAGMAFDCVLMPVKVLDYSGSGTALSLADGLYWAADNGAQVINMSLGWTPGYNPGPTVSNAVQYAYNHGVVLVASSGNAGVGTVSYPAAYSEVIAVGATRYDDQRASYSQYGTGLEIVAPGGDIGVDQNGDGYGDGILQMTFTGYDPGPPESLADPTDFGYWFYDGTSMASPHVAALVAMMIANGQTGVENIRTILHESSVDLGAAGYDTQYGYGRIDAYAALTYGEQPPVADFSGSPTSGVEPLTVSFTDLSTGSIDTWDWSFGDGTPNSSAQNPVHEYASAGDYTVTLTVTGPYGTDDETKTDYIHVDPQGTVKRFALSDIPVAGTVSGDYTLTYASDNSYEIITERDSGGKPSSRYSYLEHKWDFNVAAGTSVTFYVEAYRPDNSDGDNFTFAYSTDNVNFTPLVTVNSATEQVYSSPMPSVSGTVYIRVVDTDRTPGNRSQDDVYVDYMYIESISGPVPPVADFAGSPRSGAVPLTVDFTDLSSGEPTSWAWDFGDGVGTSTDKNPTYTYNSAGTYTVTLDVTNPYGSDTEVKTDYITVTEGGCLMHVHDMAVSRKTAGPNCSGLCTVWIRDQNGQPVESATVYLTATGPVGGSYSAVTLADGSASVETGKSKSCTGEWCFEVTNVTHASCDYDAGSNVVTISCESGHVSANGESIASHEMGARKGFYLAPSYPNPFSGVTSLRFNLPKAAHARLEIFNASGARVEVLLDRGMPAGFHSVSWNASGVPSGVYFCRLVAGAETATTRMILVQR